MGHLYIYIHIYTNLLEDYFDVLLHAQVEPTGVAVFEICWQDLFYQFDYLYI